MNFSAPILRKERTDHKVGYAELFFDLVFVLAIIMISHGLVEHFDLKGILQALFLLLAVWWVWIYTSWATNWLNPENVMVRILIFTIMLFGLLMTVSIPTAFTSSALLFALSYVAIQVGRSLFMFVVYRSNSTHKRNFLRISTWFLFSGVFWLWGGIHEELRVLLWIVALSLDYIGPVFNLWIPIIGASKSTQWDIRGEHMAERCGLFIIIALGETILVIGRTFVELPQTLEHYRILVTIFLGTVALWWIYFNIGAERGSQKISQSQDPGRIGRLTYTYFHIPIVAGILLVAAADEFVLLHPHDPSTALTMAALLGGPALFLLGNILFKRSVYGWYPQSHIAGLLILSVLFFFGPETASTLYSLAIMLLVLIAIWESLAFKLRAGQQ